MTYNFDPDQWYDNELAVIRASYETGKITRQEYEKAEKALNKRLDDMWERIDGSYHLPNK
jgi:hypothetical protein